jgi:hypothetical protein
MWRNYILFSPGGKGKAKSFDFIASESIISL